MAIIFVFAIDIALEQKMEKKGENHGEKYKKFFTYLVNKQNTCGYSLFTNCSFGTNKTKHDYYKGEDCMKNFFKDLNKHKKIIICKKLKILPFTDEQNELYTKQKSCYICRKKISSSNKKYIIPNQYH